MSDAQVIIEGQDFTPFEVLSHNHIAFRAIYEEWRNGTWLAERKKIVVTLEEDAQNKSRIHDLAELVEAKGMIPFVGAGLSIPSGFLRWGALLHLLRDHCVPPISEDDLNDIIWNDGYEVAAERILANIVPILFDERFEAYCRLIELDDVAGCVRLLPKLFNGHCATTNFDNVIELVYGGFHAAFEEVLYGKQIDQWGPAVMLRKTMLLKVHGHATAPDTRVLTQTEYDGAYAVGCPQREAFEDIVRNAPFLFLGCSLGPDRTLDVFREIYASANPPGHRNYAILPIPADHASRVDREAFLAERGIFPIWYGEHGDETNLNSPSNPYFDHDLHVESILVEFLDRQGRINELTVEPEEPTRL